MRFHSLIGAVVSAALLASCATAPKSFYANPSAVKDTPLCRAWLEAGDPTYKRDTWAEIQRRGISQQDCKNKVNAETAAIAAIAVIGTATAVGIASANGARFGGGGGGVYGVAWDQFYGQYGTLVWACRERATGQFADQYRCQGMAMNDMEWPGPYSPI